MPSKRSDGQSKSRSEYNRTACECLREYGELAKPSHLTVPIGDADATA